MLGGIMGPMDPAVATRDAEYAREYPLEIISLMSRAPIAAVAAMADPVTAAKIIEATIATMPRPPGQCPTRASEKLVIRLEIPPTAMRFPARIKRGIATKAKLSTPVNILWTMTSRGSPIPSSPKRVVAPREKEIGTPRRKTPKSPAIQNMAASPPCGRGTIPSSGKAAEKFHRVQREEKDHKSHSKRDDHIDITHGKHEVWSHLVGICRHEGEAVPQHHTEKDEDHNVGKKVKPGLEADRYCLNKNVYVQVSLFKDSDPHAEKHGIDKKDPYYISCPRHRQLKNISLNHLPESDNENYSETYSRKNGKKCLYFFHLATTSSSRKNSGG
jgi:hypothetical protein